jgi:enterobactin synthetase component D / holo-[acyl-carrier protein] synthase
LIEEILPPAVSAADTFEDAEGVLLFPEEEAAISKAVDKRRREFTTARACARQALAGLGMPAVPIVPGERGAPQWPPGVVGSMTHCCGYRASAVARACDMVTIGLDAEPDDALPDGVLDAIVAGRERALLAQLMAGTPPVAFDRLLFSAKESVYKAWFPLTGRWLGFKDATIAISPADGTFTVSLLVPGPVVNGAPLTSFAGRWLARNGLVVTAIAVPVAGTG